MQALLWPIVSWLLREVVVKFVVFAAVWGLCAVFVPYAVSYLSSFIAPGLFTSAFNGVGAGVWYFLDLFRMDYGVPLVIASYVSRFLIRRLPVIG